MDIDTTIIVTYIYLLTITRLNVVQELLRYKVIYIIYIGIGNQVGI